MTFRLEFAGRQRRAIDAGENRSLVPDRHSLSWLLVRTAWTARNLSSRGEDRRLDHLRHQFVAGIDVQRKMDTVLCTLGGTLHETKFVTVAALDMGL